MAPHVEKSRAVATRTPLPQSSPPPNIIKTTKRLTDKYKWSPRQRSHGPTCTCHITNEPGNPISWPSNTITWKKIKKKSTTVSIRDTQPRESVTCEQTVIHKKLAQHHNLGIEPIKIPTKQDNPSMNTNVERNTPHSYNTDSFVNQWQVHWQWL